MAGACPTSPRWRWAGSSTARVCARRAGRRRPGCAAVERRPIGRRRRRADHRPGRRRRGCGPAGMGRRRGTGPGGLLHRGQAPLAGRRRTAPRRPDGGICLPHDWLTWRLSADRGLDTLVTDRATRAAPPTGRRTGEYQADLLELALRGRRPAVPRVAGPAEPVGVLAGATAVLGPGTGDNAAAALGLAARPGDVVVSIGTSGVVSRITTTAVADVTGTVAGFADATGHHLPLVATLNAARVLDAGHPARGRPRDAVRPRAVGAVRRRRAGPRPLPRGGAHQPAPGDGCGPRPDPANVDPGVLGPRPPWRACCAGWPTESRRWSPRGCPSIRCCSSVVAPRPPRCSGSRPASSVSRSWSRRQVSTSPTVPPGRPRGSSPAQAHLHRGRSPASDLRGPGGRRCAGAIRGGARAHRRSVAGGGLPDDPGDVVRVRLHGVCAAPGNSTSRPPRRSLPSRASRSRTAPRSARRAGAGTRTTRAGSAQASRPVHPSPCGPRTAPERADCVPDRSAAPSDTARGGRLKSS